MGILDGTTIGGLLRPFWQGADYNIAYATARRESSFDPTVIGDQTQGGSVGLFQIHRPTWEIPLQRAGIIRTAEDLKDPITNVKAAFWIWRQEGWAPWRSSDPVVNARNPYAAGGALAGQPSAGQPPAGSGDDPYPPLTPAEQAIWDALPADVQSFYRAQPLGLPYQFLTRQEGLTDEQWEIVKHQYLIWQHAAGVLDDIGLGDDIPFSGVLDWTEALGKFFSALINPQFWKRVGIGALGAAIIVAGIALFSKNSIEEAVKP